MRLLGGVAVALVWAGCSCFQPVTEDVQVSLTATSDRLDGVRLAWNVQGASVRGFALERDGQVLAVVGPSVREQLDETAAVGQLEPPADFAASQKEKDGIRLSWSAARATQGSEHVYVLRAELVTGETVASDPVSGRRAAPPAELYELERADAGSLALTRALSFFDEDAGGWSLDASVGVTVKEDDFRTTVVLVADASIALERFPVSYRVRALQSDGGSTSSWSPVATGRRTNELYTAWQWQRSDGGANADFADLPRVTGNWWFDPYPALDQTRFYRLALRVERLGEVLSPARSATLYRPLTLVIDPQSGFIEKPMCVLRSDQALVCGAAGGGPVTVYDAGADVVELEGTTQNVCGRRRDGGVECWGPGALHPQLGPVTNLFVLPDPSQPDVCGLRAGGEAVCVNRTPASPDGGWLTLAVDSFGTACGIRRADRALDCLNGTSSSVRPGPYAQVHFSPEGTPTAALLLDGGVEPFFPDYALPPARVGYRAVFSNWRALCGVRNDGYAVCRSGDRGPARASTNVAYRELRLNSEQACGITVEDYVDCWASERSGFSSWLLLPRMPVRDVVLPSSVDLRGIDATGRYFEYGFPLEDAGVTPDDRFVALARSEVGHVTLIRDDGGVLEWPRACVPAGTWAKVDYCCGLSAEGVIRCEGWSPSGVFRDVAGGPVPCGLRFDGGLECNGAPPDLPSPGPFERIDNGGVLCAQLVDKSVVCPNGLVVPGRVVSFDIGRVGGCAVFEDAGVACKGPGLPAIPQLPVPQPPGPFRKVVTSSGGAFCGIRPDGTLACWGIPINLPVP